MFRPELPPVSSPIRVAGPVWMPPTAARPVPATVRNAPSPYSAAGRPSARLLMESIAAADKRLCQLTAMINRQRGGQLLAINERADLLDKLDNMQRRLARATSVSLHRWLTTADPGIRPDPERLQYRIQHAGLIQILRVVRTGELSTAQRLQLAAILRDVGGHPGTVRAWLGLDATDNATSGELEVERLDPPPAPTAPLYLGELLERMLPSARATELHREELAQAMAQPPADSISASRCRADRNRLLTLKEETYQRAVMVSDRFGYGKARAWRYMGRLHDPRTGVLSALSGPREKKQKQGELQLP